MHIRFFLTLLTALKSLTFAQTSLVVTSDLEGRLLPCAACPAATGYPGLARIATGLDSLRETNPDLLWVDAGNALMGGDSMASQGSAAAEMILRLRPDAINISHRDFRFGADRLLEVLAEGGLPAVSANVRAADGSQLFEPFRTVRGTTILGFTEPPAGMAFLPHLRQQLAGVGIRDPQTSLRELAPSISGSGPIVILFYGGERAASALATEALNLFPGRALHMGLSGAAANARAEGVDMTAADPSGRTLTVSGGAAAVEVSGLTLQPALQRAIREKLPEPVREETAVEASPPAQLDLSEGRQVLSTPLSGSNRGFSASVFEVAVQESLGNEDTPEGMQWLLLDVRIENDQAVDLLIELNYEEALLLGPLHRQLFVVMNGQHARAAVRPEDPVPGLLPNSVRLLRTGDGVRGQVAFLVPDEPVESLSLHYYHDLFPPLVVSLAEVPSAERPEALFEGTSDDQMQVRVSSVEELETVNGVSPPAGMVWIAVEMQGLGRRMDEIDALAAERNADPAEKIPNARVTDYLRADALLQILADGRDSFVRDESLSVLPMNPTFLPDVWTGGRMVFPVPRDAGVLELVLDFPEYRGAAGAQFPDSIRFTLRGEPHSIQEPEVLARIDDHPLPLEILSARWRENPLELEVEAQIRNVGPAGGMYKGAQRARLRMPDQSILSATATRMRGGMPAPEELWLPAGGDPRRFVFVFAPPEKAQQVDFHYNGVTSGGTIPLDFEEGLVRAGAAPETAEVSPAPRDDPESGWRAAGAEEAPRDAVADRAPAPTRPPVDYPLSVLSANPEEDPPANPIPLNLTGQNEQIQVEMSHAFVFDSAHGARLEEGNLLLGIHVTLQRRPDTEAGTEEAYSHRNWEDILFAVDGRGQLIPPHSVRNDALAISNRVWLRNQADVESGLVYFSIPAENLGHVELLWLNAEHGHMRFPIFPPGEELAEPEPAVADANRLVSMQVHGTWAAETMDGRAAPTGTWRVFDVRGRSLREPVGSNLAAESVLPRNWQYRMILQLNGRDTFSIPPRGMTLDEDWRLTPLRHTGGQVAFALPDGIWENAQTAELILSFGPHETGPDQHLRVPDLLRIPLKGELSPTHPSEDYLVLDQDMDLEMRLLGYEHGFELPGSNAGPVWFAVDLELTATHPEGVFVEPGHRFQLLSSEGNPRRLSYVHYGQNINSVRGNRNTCWLPPGVPVPLRMVWRVSEEEQRDLRLLHAGSRVFTHYPVGPRSEDAELPPFNPAVSGHGIQLWDPGLEPQGLEGVGLTPEQVNNAIDRGRDFLWQQLQAGYVNHGRFQGRRFLLIGLYALVNVRAHEDFPEFDALLREYLHRVNPNDLQVYEIGLLAMIIRAYGDPEFYGKLEQVTRWLVEAQGEWGTWNYTADVPERFFPSTVPERAESAGPFQIEGGEPPPEVPERDPEATMYRTISFRRGRDGDNSTTQFAVLGLWASERAGIRMDADIWERTFMRAAAYQGVDAGDELGGFSYSGMARRSYGSMTAAGLCTLALSLRHLDAEADVRSHPRILNALGWLAREFSVSENLRRNSYHYYYLYSIERVGQILGTEFIGEHEWYPLGARHLVDTQSEAGNWPSRQSENNQILTTSYALLFLVRATPAMDEEIVPEPEPEGQGRLVTTFAQPADAVDLYVIFDASGSMRAEVEGVSKFELARQALIDLVAALPDNSQLALRAFGHRFHALHARADEDTELIIPRGPLERERFNQVMQRLRPRGKTPLALTLEEAARDLRGGRGSLPIQVIMFTDGAEDTREDPVEAARNFARTAGDIQFTMLGFNIQNPVWLRQLNEVASTAGGLYVNVEDPRFLLRELENIINPPAPAFVLMDAEGNRIAEDLFGAEIPDLEPGEYRLQSELPGKTLETTFWVRPGRDTRIHFDWEQAMNP
jgi:hypothetical protein